MDTSDKWNVPSLKEALENSVVHNLKVGKIKFGNTYKTKYLCKCGIWAWPFQIQDVRKLVGVEDDFLCDGCMETLRRKLADIDNTGKPVNRKAFKKKLMALQEAPETILEKMPDE